MSEKLLPQRAPAMSPGLREAFGPFVRETRFEPGFALTPNYGRSALRIRFLLHGSAASVQFLFSTGLIPEQVSRDRSFGNYNYTSTEWLHTEPMGHDLGYHADAAQYEGQEDMGGRMECDVRASGHCYYDGSGLQADEVLEVFFKKGEEAMWTLLQERYIELFGEPGPLPVYALRAREPLS